MSGFFRYSVSRWLASISTSWTMSRGVHPAGEGRVEPQVDDPAERLAELAEQAIDGPGVAVAGVVEQPVGLVAGRPHGEM